MCVRCESLAWERFFLLCVAGDLRQPNSNQQVRHIRRGGAHSPHNLCVARILDHVRARALGLCKRTSPLHSIQIINPLCYAPCTQRYHKRARTCAHAWQNICFGNLRKPPGAASPASRSRAEPHLFSVRSSVCVCVFACVFVRLASIYMYYERNRLGAKRRTSVLGATTAHSPAAVARYWISLFQCSPTCASACICVRSVLQPCIPFIYNVHIFDSRGVCPPTPTRRHPPQRRLQQSRI